MYDDLYVRLIYAPCGVGVIHCDGPVANMSRCQHTQLQAGGPGAKIRAYSVEVRLECPQYEDATSEPEHPARAPPANPIALHRTGDIMAGKPLPSLGRYENNDHMLEELGECKDASEDVLMGFA